jgi:hypothetical protein
MKHSIREQTGNDSRRIEVVEVRSPEQLAAVAALRPLRRFISAKRLLLRIPSVKAPLQQATERRLNFWLRVCGCQAGALLLLAALAWQIGVLSRAHATPVKAVLLGSMLVAAAGIVGKAISLLIARAMFMAEAALFLRRISARRGKRQFLI